MWLDRPLREHIRLALQFSIFVQHLQCGKQGKGTVLRKCGHIRTGIDQPVLLGKVIIKRIELLLFLFDFIIWIVGSLHFNQAANTVPYGNHTFNPVFSRCRTFNRSHSGIFTVIDFIVHNRIGKVAYFGIGGNGVIFFGQFLVHFVIRDLCVDIGDGFVQKLRKVSIFIGYNGIFLAESAGHGFPFA